MKILTISLALIFLLNLTSCDQEYDRITNKVKQLNTSVHYYNTPIFRIDGAYNFSKNLETAVDVNLGITNITDQDIKATLLVIYKLKNSNEWFVIRELTVPTIRANETISNNVLLNIETSKLLNAELQIIVTDINKNKESTAGYYWGNHTVYKNNGSFENYNLWMYVAVDGETFMHSSEGILFKSVKGYFDDQLLGAKTYNDSAEINSISNYNTIDSTTHFIQSSDFNSMSLITYVDTSSVSSEIDSIQTIVQKF